MKVNFIIDGGARYRILSDDGRAGDRADGRRSERSCGCGLP
jgi:hypothetical protein